VEQSRLWQRHVVDVETRLRSDVSDIEARLSCCTPRHRYLQRMICLENIDNEYCTRSIANESINSLQVLVKFVSQSLVLISTRQLNRIKNMRQNLHPMSVE
jgi:hypothetical protein